jgi:hypothetical protein
MMGLTGAAPRDGYSSQVASVQYPRASLYDGLPLDLLEVTDELMSNRLAPSSMATVNIAFERYKEALEQEVEAIGPGPALHRGLLEGLVVHLVPDELLIPHRPLRLDAGGHRVALEEVDGLASSRAVSPPIEGTPTRAPPTARIAIRARRIRKDRRPGHLGWISPILWVVALSA